MESKAVLFSWHHPFRVMCLRCDVPKEFVLVTWKLFFRHQNTEVLENLEFCEYVGVLKLKAISKVGQFHTKLNQDSMD